jgi:hypothetical protein
MSIARLVLSRKEVSLRENALVTLALVIRPGQQPR